MSLTGNPNLVDPGFDPPPSDPLLLFRKWLKTANEINVCEPYAMVLATVDVSHHPSSRVVVLKECDETGFIFGTHQNSRKGEDLQPNPWAAGTLYWRETMQQINVCGQVTQLGQEKSDALFYERPREAQAVTALSHQSAPLTEEEALKERIARLIRSQNSVERPMTWHAYRLAVISIEFWHGSQDRFHKRLRYDLIDGAWQYQRLQP
jgi:pyridoxamine 5'-phosphate oxidase